MPALLGGIGAYLSQVLTVGTVVKGVIGLAASYALGTLAVALAPKPKITGDTSERAIMTRSAVARRRLVYGARLLTSGPLVYAEATGTYREYMHLIIALAGHELATPPMVYYFDDTPIGSWLLDGSGTVTSERFAGIALLQFFSGSTTQTVCTALRNASAGKWSDAHRLQGIAYLYVRLLRDDRKYQYGVPAITAVLTGKHCYDVRDTTTHATENPALILYDALLFLGWDSTELDSATFTAAANICEERVSVEDYSVVVTPDATNNSFVMPSDSDRIGTGDGVWVSSTGSLPAPLASSTMYYVSRWYNRAGLHPTYADAVANTNRIDLTTAGSGAVSFVHKDQTRYACNGSWEFPQTQEEVQELLDGILSSMVGTLVNREGKWYCYAGAYTAPTLTIDESWLRGPLKLTPTLSRSSLYNAVRGTFSEANRRWQQTDYPMVASATYETEDGEFIARDYPLPATTNAIMAQRIARVVLERARRQEQVVLQCNLKAMQVATWDTVQLSIASLSISGAVYRVTGWSMAAGDGGLVGVDLTLQKEDSTVYSWTASDATLPDPPGDLVLPDPDVPSPGSPMLSESLYETTGSVGVRSRATFTWTAAISGESQSVAYELAYKLTAASTYTTLPMVRDTRLVVDDLAPAAYDVRLRTVAGTGAVSEWVTSTVQIIGLSAPPATPTNFSVVPIGGHAQLSWDAHPDLDVRIGGRIYARHSPATSAATWNESSDLTRDGYPGRDSYATAPLKEGTYFVKAVDSSGIASSSAASFVVKFADLNTFTTVDTITEDPSFSGTFSNTGKDATGVKLSGATLWDSISGNIDDWTLLDSIGGVSPSGTYTFANRLDLGAVETVRLYGHLKVAAFDTADAIDLRTDSIDEWSDFDGLTVDDSSALLMVRATDDDPNGGSPTWGSWGHLQVNDVTARGFEFRVDLYSDNPTHNVLVTQARVTAKQFA